MTAAEKEYGGALYALAAEEHCEDAVLEGLTLAADAFRETPGYLKLVQNPAVPREERLAMLDEAFGAGVHVYVLNFLKILCGKSALGMAAGCLQEYKALLYEARGILPVQAVSAVPLDEAQRRALCDSLAQKDRQDHPAGDRCGPVRAGRRKAAVRGAGAGRHGRRAAGRAAARADAGVTPAHLYVGKLVRLCS